ncbi:unnamed protein product [Caenorhabditis nigoni]
MKFVLLVDQDYFQIGHFVFSPLPSIIRKQLRKYFSIEPSSSLYKSSGRFRMEIAQDLITPSLEEILRSLQYDNLPSNSKKKDRKRSSQSDEAGKKKRNRITFDSAQIDEMEKVFAENQYPDATSRDQLASRIQLHEERVQIWFQNRRAKYRREQKNTSSPEKDESSGKYEIQSASLDDILKKGKSSPVMVKEAAATDMTTSKPPALLDSSASDDFSAALNLILNQSAVGNDHSSSSETENEDNEQLNIENANILMLTLSQLLTMQPESIFST